MMNYVTIKKAPGPTSRFAEQRPQLIFVPYDLRSMPCCRLDHGGDSVPAQVMVIKCAVHPNAVDENEIVDWTLRKFSKLEIKNKMLLLQYERQGLDTTEVAERRKLILGIANELSLKVIDTYVVLRNAKEKRPQLCNGCRNPSPLMDELWYLDNSYHHTPLGNELVCSYLFEQGFSKQTITFRSPSTIR